MLFVYELGLSLTILKWHWKEFIPPTSIILPSSTSCSKPANSRNDSAVKENKTYESNANANMQNVLQPMDANTQEHSNTNACIPAHRRTQKYNNYVLKSKSNYPIRLRPDKTNQSRRRWARDSPMFISSSVRESPMKSNWNDWRVWENFCTAREYSVDQKQRKAH